MPPVVDKTKCTGCGVCWETCCEDVFFGSTKKSPPLVTYPEECWHCNACVLDCPEKAVSLRIPLPAMLAIKPD